MKKETWIWTAVAFYGGMIAAFFAFATITGILGTMGEVFHLVYLIGYPVVAVLGGYLLAKKVSKNMHEVCVFVNCVIAAVFGFCNVPVALYMIGGGIAGTVCAIATGRRIIKSGKGTE